METKLISPINNSYINSAKPADKKEPPKQKTSSKVIKGVSVAAAAGITALAIGGLMYKNKISPNILKLNGAIDFKEAKTLQEAIEYGINKLGIKEYVGFTDQDLDVVNWINDGLTRCANHTKNKGHIVMPNKIFYLDAIDDIASKSGTTNYATGAIYPHGIFGISKKGVEKVKEEVFDILEFNKMKVNPEDLNFTKICELYTGFIEEVDLDTVSWSGSPYSTIVHEMGHLQHEYNLKSHRAFYSIGQLEQRPEKLAKGAKELLELFESKQDVAGKVSNYAKVSPLEFVAEVYAQLVHGIKFDDDVMELYQKLGGVV